MADAISIAIAVLALLVSTYSLHYARQDHKAKLREEESAQRLQMWRRHER